MTIIKPEGKIFDGAALIHLTNPFMRPEIKRAQTLCLRSARGTAKHPFPDANREPRPWGRVSVSVVPETENWRFSDRTTNTLTLNFIFDFLNCYFITL